MLLHTVSLSRKKFTENELSLSLKYINPEVYPEMYDNQVLGGDIEFVDRRLMSFKDVENDVREEAFSDLDLKGLDRDYFLTQHSSIRSHGRGKNADKLGEEIHIRGFELHHSPISVAKCPDGKVYRVDGRTRLEELKNANFSNVIVDYYICKTWPAYYTLAIKRNPPESTRSPMTKEDIISQCNYFVKQGWLLKKEDQISAHVRNLTNNRVKTNTLRKIVHNVMYGSSFTSSVLSLDENKANAWLKRFGYIDNEHSNGIYYKVVSASAWTKAISSAAQTLDNLRKQGKKVKELRVVIHTGTLEGADPIKSWQDKVDSFRLGWSNNMDVIQKSFFETVVNSNTIKLFGAIPAVSAMSSDYPMDRLVMFHTGKLKDKLFLNLVDDDEDESGPGDFPMLQQLVTEED